MRGNLVSDVLSIGVYELSQTHPEVFERYL